MGWRPYLLGRLVPFFYENEDVSKTGTSSTILFQNEKLKFNRSILQNRALTRVQLKGVKGGSGSDSGSLVAFGCEGKKYWDSCYYCNGTGTTKTGTCKCFYNVLTCWAG